MVDPFVRYVNQGEPFLVMLVPDAVTKLVHHYELSFPDVPVKEKEPVYEEDDGCRGCY